MKNFIWVFFLVLAFAKAETLTAQNYKQHTVTSGETLGTIAKKYSISEKELLALNPDAKSGVRAGASLLIPADAKVLTQKRVKEYKKYKVRRKETLYSISKEYGITVLDIKEANKRLYAETLKKGDRIQIPVFHDEPENEPILGLPNDLNQTEEQLAAIGKYRVKASEGYYRVAKKNGITVEQLKEMNPDVEQLKPDMLINVPKKELDLEISGSKTEQAIDLLADNIDILDEVRPELVEFEVPHKMGMYSLKRMSGISEDSLISLNPELKDGLKAGMVLKIPNSNLIDTLQIYEANYKIAKLVDSITSYEPQRFAVMLPLSLDKINDELDMEEHLKTDATSRIATDFLIGLMMARDSAMSIGLQVTYDVYDTERSESAVRSILLENKFENYTGVIGPLFSKNVLQVAKELRSDRIPVISPLTNTDVELYRNLVQTRPSDDLLKLRMKQFLKIYAKGKNVIIVTDNKKPQLRSEFSALFPDAKVLIPNEKKNYIYKVNYLKELDPVKENIVILAVDQVGFITDAVTTYSAKTDTHNITMFGMDAYDDMDLPNGRLASLNYTFPQFYKDAIDDNPFVRDYREKYGMLPNKYVARGFDVGFDVILRQASTGDFFDSLKKYGLTKMVESKFDYSKQLFKGYYNEAVFMLQYQKDLSIKEIEITPLKTR
ncbi:peptidoglycan-binding protein [Nonlabens spongiae]|uniref:Peptidoglycan-binding protein n=1 Tax=Nonlabens spongiae TaxID=331648 RepID=A0A1W6MJB6_9FLAO|nr:LysM peptidoglycan-binding domain-containing protein [Nonlabens spongiae]ARN77673.1 peptidoglycan-binding protein [Nonlabens spongiae]